jgi:superfamily I DNA and/or RNA helicase
MLELKSFGDGIDHGRWPRFRSVIVDEAARCNPLDLMIPLCLAQRRIVLVGDHRQLPHVLEPGVERELNRSADELTREALGKSLFERLAKHVRELEARDGIIRYVRLDRQYRMAPSLGKFVSDSFYAPYGEQFESGRTESELSHRLGGPYEGKRGVWIDCPIAEGAETRGRSKARPAEADRIARTIVDRFADRPDLSVGIITFYAAQVKEIERALALRGIGEERHGKWEIPSGWRSTVASEGREVRDRIRVGTVDAFQGMEFDVVFLSTVRSNDLPLGDNPSWFRKFGHLLLENRVCVAMSRQERLLFVVGDSRMFEPSDRQDQPGVRQLRDFFLNFCGGPHGLRL